MIDSFRVIVSVSRRWLDFESGDNTIFSSSVSHLLGRNYNLYNSSLVSTCHIMATYIYSSWSIIQNPGEPEYTEPRGAKGNEYVPMYPAKDFTSHTLAMISSL